MSDPIVFRCKKCGHSFERHERGFCKHCTCTKYTGPEPKPEDRPTEPTPMKPIVATCDTCGSALYNGFCYACCLGLC